MAPSSSPVITAAAASRMSARHKRLHGVGVANDATTNGPAGDAEAEATKDDDVAAAAAAAAVTPRTASAGLWEPSRWLQPRLFNSLARPPSQSQSQSLRPVVRSPKNAKAAAAGASVAPHAPAPSAAGAAIKAPIVLASYYANKGLEAAAVELIGHMNMTMSMGMTMADGRPLG